VARLIISKPGALSHPKLRSSWLWHLERFPAKWIPVRVKKTRQNKKESLRSDSIGTEKALAHFSIFAKVRFAA
jgi:hypothetical protein